MSPLLLDTHALLWVLLEPGRVPSGTLTWSHRDPFDRVIVAQCMIESLPLVTADAALAAFPGITTVWGAASAG